MKDILRYCWQRSWIDLVLVVCTTSVVYAANTERPNILIVLADDLGYADLGCQGCKDIPTPDIDSLAQHGVRFTDGYATHPVCAPSRAALLTGHEHWFGSEHGSGPKRCKALKDGRSSRHSLILSFHRQSSLWSMTIRV